MSFGCLLEFLGLGLELNIKQETSIKMIVIVIKDMLDTELCHLFRIQMLVCRCFDKLDLGDMVRPQAGQVGRWVSCHKFRRVAILWLDGALQPSGQICPDQFLVSFQQLSNSSVHQIMII